jgi:hypothetical protein
MKRWLQGLPTTPLRVVASVFVFVLTSLAVVSRLIRGQALPDNYEWFFAMILGVMGVDTVHFYTKRKTEWRPSTDMVDMTTRRELDPEKVAVTQEHEMPVRRRPLHWSKQPPAGEERDDFDSELVEAYAERQQASISNPGEADD